MNFLAHLHLAHLADIVGDNLCQHRRTLLLVAVLDGRFLRFRERDTHAPQCRGHAHHCLAHKVGHIDGVPGFSAKTALLRHKVIHRRNKHLKR